MRLSKDIGVTPQAAQEFIDAYFAGFPRIRAFIDRTLEGARASGVVRTLFGRRRLMAELNSRNPRDRQRAEREAVNMPIQGTAADIMKRAMIDVHHGARRHARRAHDSHGPRRAVVRSAGGGSRRGFALVRRLMQDAVALSVPLTVDVGMGPNWKDAKS